MPKLKSHTFKLSSKAGECIEFASEVSVNSEGVFAVTYPEEYDLDIQANLIKGCKATQPRKYCRVESKTLNDAIKSIENGIKSLLDTKETHELVIWYKFITQCHYAVDSETGTIYSNAALAINETGKKYGHNGAINWVDNGATKGFTAFDAPEPYTVSIQATVMRKTTYTSKSNERVEYFNSNEPLNYSNGETLPMGECGEKLRGFNHTNLSEHDTEIPYTEEAAKFFHDAMLSICSLSDKLTHFFADQNNVMAAIENNAQMLPFVSQSQIEES